jgi:predicted nucleic acid-binding protein
VSASESPLERPVVADTVVVNYFLATGAFDLLRALLGGAIRVPRAVFDPDEPDSVDERAASELRRGLRLHRRRVDDPEIGKALRERSARALPHFERLESRVADGELQILDLTADELTCFANLRDPAYVSQFSLAAGLGRGEAAALSIALARGYGLATDDEDAIKVAGALNPELEIHRIRSLLARGVNLGVMTRERALKLHADMVGAGFWDSGTID